LVAYEPFIKAAIMILTRYGAPSASDHRDEDVWAMGQSIALGMGTPSSEIQAPMPIVIFFGLLLLTA
jgi:hypothetical protein